MSALMSSKWATWWYMVYSDKSSFMRKVQYFKGRTLDELKACTANDAGIWPDDHEGFLDSRGFYAGQDSSKRWYQPLYLGMGVLTRKGKDNTEVGASPAEPEWAGNLVAHKLIQHEDGTLTLGEVEAISNKYNKECEVEVKEQNGMTASGGTYTLSGYNAYMLMSRLGYHNKISFTVTTSNQWDKFGISLARGTNSNADDATTFEKCYTMVVNPESDTRRKVNFEEEGDGGKGFIEGIDGYNFARPSDNGYNITIYTDNSICVMYINDAVCYTNRIYGIQKNCWSINNYGGNITVSNLKISQY